MTMRKYIKNCNEKSYESQLGNTHDFDEFYYSQNYYKKAELSYTNDFERESIDDYFTSIQIMSNAILLKKLDMMSKVSNCGYYKLYEEKIISTKLYENIEKIREERNKVHYHGHIALFMQNDEIEKIVILAKEIYAELKEIYED